MAQYLGTSGRDTIYGPLVAADTDQIDALEGNDTVTLGPNQTFISGIGDDIVIGANGTSQYALWSANDISYVDLSQGYALDGFGGSDKLSGVGVVHMSRLGGTVIGSGNNESVFSLGGKIYIDLGAGIDTVTYWGQKSTSYEVFDTGADFRINNLSTGLIDTLVNVEYIKFSDKTINTAYAESKLKANFQYTAYSFTETEMAPGYVYANVAYPSGLISWSVGASFVLDLDGDGKLDIIAPTNKGYATGLNTRQPFVALTGASGVLKFDDSINAQMPVTAGARRSAPIHLIASGTGGVVTVGHDAGDGKLADLTILTDNLSGPLFSTYIPQLPSAMLNREFALNSHSMAVGDINGDSMDDVLIGDWGNWNSTIGMYSLIQQADGNFNISNQDAYRKIILNWPMANLAAGQQNNLLLDIHLADVNGDGYDDLIAGWGHGSTHSYIFLNTQGKFSIDAKIALPDSIYGIDNQLHLRTFHFDFNNDGAMDLAVLWGRYVPYYGGNYIQLLQNDGSGNFTDVTAARIDIPAQDSIGGRLQWNNNWQLLDVNGDGAIDIVGQRSGESSLPVAYLNDGNGYFTVTEIPTSGLDIGAIIQWADIDQDGAVEIIGFRAISISGETGTSSENQFDVFKLTGDALLSERLNPVKTGTLLPDVLVGNDSNESFIGKQGNDTIAGGSGIDLAVFSGAAQTYSIVVGSGTLTIQDVTGIDGTDNLASVERLRFSNKNIAFDTDSPNSAGGIYRLYKAALDRTPDLGGLGYWIAQADAGTKDAVRMAADFTYADEFKTLYGVQTTDNYMTGEDITALVTKIYENVLNRAPDAGGRDYYAGQITAKSKTVGQVLAEISDSTENKLAVADLIGTGIEYTPWVG